MWKVKEFPCGCKLDVNVDSNGKIVGVDWNPDKTNLNCQKTWDMVCNGKTGGVFQLETFLGKSYAKKFKPRSIPEWSDLIAGIRPGCVSSGVKIRQYNKYLDYLKTPEINIEDLYKSEDRNIVSLNEDTHELFQNEILNVWHNGVKPVYNVIFRKRKESNTDYHKTNKLICTLDHKIWTSDGYKELKDLEKGDRVAFRYKYIPNRSDETLKPGKVPGQHFFKTICFKAYKYKCIFCDWNSGSLDTNHLVGNRRENNNVENLCFMCPNHHRMYSEGSISLEEAVEARKKYILPYSKDIFWVEYDSIQLVGERDVYDISVKGPYHNFIAGDVVVHNCLDAEVDGKNMANHYADRKSGRDEVIYDHPALEPILKETYGVNLYQESSMKISMEAAGFNGREADNLRRCLSADSFFQTNYGTLSITDIIELFNKNKNIYVLTVENNKNIYKKITNAWKQPNKKRTLVINASGHNLRCTYDHKIFTNNGWKQAQNLTTEDYICINGNTHEFDKYKIEYFSNVNLSYLYGMFLSEGCMTENAKSPKITNSNQEIIDKILQITKDEFKDGVNLIKFKNGVSDIYFNGNAAAHFAKTFPYNKSRNKFLPIKILKLNLECIKAFLGAYFSGDGWINKDAACIFSSTSKKISRQIQGMLNRIGIISTLCYKKTKYKNSVYYSYDVNICTLSEIQKFYLKVGKYLSQEKLSLLKERLENRSNDSNSFFVVPENVYSSCINELNMNLLLSPHKISSGNCYKKLSYEKARYLNTIIKNEFLDEVLNADYKFCKITSITPYGKEDVFDFTLDDDTPYAYVNGIIAHNSIGKKKPAEMAKLKNKFIEGCKQHSKMDDKTAEQIFANIEASQRYSFCRSHSVAYSINGYIYSAYPKAHFPKVFYATQLDNGDLSKRKENDIAIADIIEDGLAFGVKFAAPDIRYCNTHAIIDGDTIIPGLAKIKYMNEAIVKTLPHKPISYYQFLYKHLYNMQSRAVEALILSGATAFFGFSRQQQLFEVKDVLKHLSQEQVNFLSEYDYPLLQGLRNIADRPTGRGQLCYNITSKKKIERFIEKLENPPFKLDDNCRLIANWEREYIGREMTCTELDVPGVHDSYNCINCQFVENLNGAENSLYNLPLIVKSFNEFKTKSGGKMCFLRGYDITGAANNIGVFSDVYYKFRKHIYTGNKLLLRGSFSKDIFVVREIIEI